MMKQLISVSVAAVMLAGCSSGSHTPRSPYDPPPQEYRPPPEYGQYPAPQPQPYPYPPQPYPAPQPYPPGPYPRGEERDLNAIPRYAEVVARGKGRIGYRADRDGTAWVVDRDDERVVVVARIDRSDVLEVQPGDDRVLLNGRRIYDQNMEGQHTHAVYFAAERGGRGGPRDPRDRPPGRPNRLPPELDGARRVAFGSGGDLSFTARSEGTVFVYDVTERRIAYAGELPRNSKVLVSARRDVVSVNGKEMKVDLRSNHEYELYFRG